MSREPKSSWRLPEGDEIAPGLTALRPLGGGRDYEAYLAFDEHRHSVVVVKVLRPARCEDRRSRGRLAAEAETISRLEHPAIVRAFDAVLDGPRPHLVLEHLEGPRLSALSLRRGPLAVEQLVPLAVQLCSARHYMSREGIAHLDLKPSNVIMSAPPRLIDLSLARSVEAAAELTRPIGTPAYMAPEQCDPSGRGPVGRPADVWGLGATLQHAATGAKPFPSSNREAAESSGRYPQLVESPLPLDGVDERVTGLIGSCLELDPAQRPAAMELADAFEAILGELPRLRARRRTC